MTAGGLLDQVKSSLMVMIWVFVGIEGAAMMGDRAKKNLMQAARQSLVLSFYFYLHLAFTPTFRLL